MVRAIACCVLSLVVVSIPPAPARADQAMVLQARLAQSVMKAGTAQRNYLRIGLNGCERPPSERTPVNVAFVIDRSGSMQGDRIAQARDAAIAAVRRLDKNDIASVIIFDDKIDVLVQAQNVTDYSAFTDRIRQVAARGSTAIYGGVNEGANQVRINKNGRYLNRVVLLSDGQANVGPRRPVDFEKLGRDLQTEGISVSTIGLGMQYNEDLMLAARARERRQPYLRGRRHRPHPGVQQGVRRRAGVLRADRLDRRGAQARRAGGARTEPRRQDRGPDRAVHA